MSKNSFWKKILFLRYQIPLFPKDVFLVSYPRSGNTWIRYLLANLLKPNAVWHINNIGRIVPDIYEDDLKILRQEIRIIKSHEQYCSTYPKVIYLFRDGRDVALSYHNFSTKLLEYKGDFKEFLQDMLEGNLPFGSWQDHISSWLFDHSHDNLLPISYEFLYKDPLNELDKIGGFLGFQWSNLELELALSKSTLDKQRHDFLKYRNETHWNKGFRGGIKGSPGKWRDVFSDDLNNLFWKHAGDIAEKLGYSKNGESLSDN